MLIHILHEPALITKVLCITLLNSNLTGGLSCNQTLHEQQQTYYKDVIFDVDANDDRTIESDGDDVTSSEGTVFFVKLLLILSFDFQVHTIYVWNHIVM